MSIQYKVIAYGSQDGLKFPDLMVKFTSGYMLPLQVKQNELVPLDILDPMDVKKSLIVGSLGKFISSGAVAVLDDTVKPEPIIEAPKPVVAAPVEAPKPVTQEIPTAVVTSEGATLEKAVEVREVIAVKPQDPAPSSLGDVKSVEDFYRLGYFLKVKFIESCNDVAFLQKALAKADGTSPQMKTNLQIKITRLTTK